jgi:predicted RNase H-like HicB family nuclease
MVDKLSGFSVNLSARDCGTGCSDGKRSLAGLYLRQWVPIVVLGLMFEGQCAVRGDAMTFTITITRDEDGVYIAECPAIPGCMSQGKTEAEAQANVQDAIKQCLEVRAEMGMPLTVLTRQVEVIA